MLKKKKEATRELFLEICAKNDITFSDEKNPRDYIEAVDDNGNVFNLTKEFSIFKPVSYISDGWYTVKSDYEVTEAFYEVRCLMNKAYNRDNFYNSGCEYQTLPLNTLKPVA